MISELRDLKLEIDYGIKYLLKVGPGILPDNLMISYRHMLQARELIGSYINGAMSYNPYWESDDPRCVHIEESTDCVDEKNVQINKKYSRVKHIKFLREGTKEIRKKLELLQASSLGDKGFHFLDGATISLEIAYIWLREELLVLKEKDTKPSTKEELEVSKTEELINKRIE